MILTYNEELVNSFLLGECLKMKSSICEYSAITEKFNLEEKIQSAEPCGEGHINSTILITTDKKRYILQKINSSVFKDVEALMNNISCVTEYLTGLGVETLRVIKTKDGKNYLKDGESYYRIYDFIENTVTYQTATDAEILKYVGEAFGSFQNRLSGFDTSVLAETIPDFHNTPKRYRDFLAALDKDVCKRAESCREEIDFIVSHKDTYSKITDALADGTLPMRVTHNDTKLNNILIDEKTKLPRAVIDLDTIMQGSMLYDFGDSIRFGASTAREDEKDLSKVHFDISLYEAYASGFCTAVKESITEKERELLPYGSYLMTVECGMRFLTDYLSGDTYFAIKYPEHNLVRARTQIKLASEMEKQFDKMLNISNKFFI